MTKPAKPFSIKTVLAVGFGMALAFSMLSLFFLVVQTREGMDRIVGEVIAIEAHGLSIINARGHTTKLIVPKDAHLFRLTAISNLKLGQHIMSRGIFTNEGTFEVDRLRIVED